jgi:hypothetical protein
MGYASTLKTEKVEEKPRTGCHAYGCPFPPGLSAGAGAPGFCRHHYEVPSVQWPAITDAMINEHARLLQEVLIARRYFGRGDAGNDPERLSEAWMRLERHGYPLEPHREGKPLTYRQWAGMAESLLAQHLRNAGIRPRI